MPDQPAELRVMSFNIRYRTASDGAHAWSRRKAKVLERIRRFTPDLLGVQECRDDSQAGYLQRHLPEYAWLGVRRGAPGSQDIEMAPLLYRSAVFKLLDWGVFWLSQTPDTPGSLSWGPNPSIRRNVWLGGSLPRTLIWARLRRLEPPHLELAFLNTHLDHASPLARWRGAGLLRRFMRRAFPTLPLILTGDFNTGRASSVHRHLLAGSRSQPGLQDAHIAATSAQPDMTNAHLAATSSQPDMTNAHLALSASAGAPPGSFHDFGRLEPALDIDWILSSTHFSVLQAGVDTDAGSASDHYPVWAVLRLGVMVLRLPWLSHSRRSNVKR